MREGVSTLTRMPSRLASIASVREKITSPAIAVAITDSPGVATLAASDATLMITPLPCVRIQGRTRRHIRSGAIRRAKMIGPISLIAVW